MIGLLGAIWGVFGVCLILANAVWRLGLVSWEVYLHHMDELTSIHWLLTALWVIFMIISEGYRGFHKQFSPRVIARAIYLKNNPTPIRIILAPLFCMGFFHATRKRLIVTYCLTTGIILAIILIRWLLEQPIRGLVDLGVVSGLAVGLASIGFFIAKALFSSSFSVDPEVPVSS